MLFLYHKYNPENKITRDYLLGTKLLLVVVVLEMTVTATALTCVLYHEYIVKFTTYLLRDFNLLTNHLEINISLFLDGLPKRGQGWTLPSSFFLD